MAELDAVHARESRRRRKEEGKGPRRSRTRFALYRSASLRKKEGSRAGRAVLMGFSMVSGGVGAGSRPRKGKHVRKWSPAPLREKKGKKKGVNCQSLRPLKPRRASLFSLFLSSEMPAPSLPRLSEEKTRRSTSLGPYLHHRASNISQVERTREFGSARNSNGRAATNERKEKEKREGGIRPTSSPRCRPASCRAQKKRGGGDPVAILLVICHWRQQLDGVRRRGGESWMSLTNIPLVGGFQNEREEFVRPIILPEEREKKKRRRGKREINSLMGSRKLLYEREGGGRVEGIVERAFTLQGALRKRKRRITQVAVHFIHTKGRITEQDCNWIETAGRKRRGEEGARRAGDNAVPEVRLIPHRWGGGEGGGEMSVACVLALSILPKKKGEEGEGKGLANSLIRRRRYL